MIWPFRRHPTWHPAAVGRAITDGSHLWLRCLACGSVDDLELAWCPPGACIALSCPSCGRSLLVAVRESWDEWDDWAHVCDGAFLVPIEWRERTVNP